MRFLAVLLIALSSGCATPKGDGQVCRFDATFGAICTDKSKDKSPAEMDQQGWFCMSPETFTGLCR